MIKVWTILWNKYYPLPNKTNGSPRCWDVIMRSSTKKEKKMWWQMLCQGNLRRKAPSLHYHLEYRIGSIRLEKNGSLIPISLSSSRGFRKTLTLPKCIRGRKKYSGIRATWFNSQMEEPYRNALLSFSRSLGISKNQCTCKAFFVMGKYEKGYTHFCRKMWYFLKKQRWNGQDFRSITVVTNISHYRD